MTEQLHEFYRQFKDARSFFLSFPVYPDIPIEETYCDPNGELISEGMTGWDEDEITAIALGNNTFQIADFTDVFCVFGLLWGDVFYAEQDGSNLKFSGIEMPRRYKHYTSVGGGGIGGELSEIIHRLGGGWGVGLVTDIIIPAEKAAEYEKEYTLLQEEWRKQCPT